MPPGSVITVIRLRLSSSSIGIIPIKNLLDIGVDVECCVVVSDFAPQATEGYRGVPTWPEVCTGPAGVRDHDPFTLGDPFEQLADESGSPPAADLTAISVESPAAARRASARAGMSMGTTEMLPNARGNATEMRVADSIAGVEHAEGRPRRMMEAAFGFGLGELSARTAGRV